MDGRAGSEPISEFCRLACQILLYHERYLEGHGVVKLAQVKPCELAYFFEAVNKGVSVYEELSRCLGDVEVVFKEALHGHERLTVERLERPFLEHLLEEYLAESCRELIDKSADTEILVGHDRLLYIKDFSDLESYSDLLVSLRQILEVCYDGGDANDDLCRVIVRYGLDKLVCNALELLVLDLGINLLDYNYILLADIYYIGAGFIRDYVLYYLVGGGLRRRLELHDEYDAGLVIDKMKLV